ncbi:hypothetical protein COU54_01895 [Candidatus Pacearchaeota archaeon CG10_big_fil_rev_8_21_14_0_10_31_24]|nr:MAG: hypothetical protein COU54_01895 [Candidatus Pacearchaeota archaeon CG10_big_fil_rev_8_21_14_0_10_31_24]
MSQQLIQEIISKVKEKRELQGISNDIIQEILNKYLSKYRINLTAINPSGLKLLIKEIRSELRNYNGRFQINLQDRDNLIGDEDYDSLLKTHTSTSERFEDYRSIKEFISSCKVKSILDLGCGLNPLAMADSSVKYYASDIREDELKIISRFFKSNKIDGQTFIYNLKNITQDLPSVDICFLMKVLDILEKKSHKLAEKILSSIDTKYFLISFSTKTLSGRPMNHIRRVWMEYSLKRLNYQFKILKLKNEIFYLVTKSSQN